MTPSQVDTTYCQLHHRLPDFLRWWSARLSALLPSTKARLCGVFLLLCLPGCGPGTGGTGTGSIVAPSSAVISFSGTASPAAPQPVLPSDGTPGPVVQPPASSPSGSSSAPLLPPNTALVPEFCVVNCSGAGVRLLIDSRQVQLLEHCTRFLSYGPLELAALGETVVAGTFESRRSDATETRTIAALLIVEFVGGVTDSSKVKVRVVDNAGVLLLGPLNLLRDSADPDQSNAPSSTPSPTPCGGR